MAIGPTLSMVLEPQNVFYSVLTKERKVPWFVIIPSQEYLVHCQKSVICKLTFFSKLAKWAKSPIFTGPYILQDTTLRTFSLVGFPLGVSVRDIFPHSLYLTFFYSYSYSLINSLIHYIEIADDLLSILKSRNVLDGTLVGLVKADRCFKCTESENLKYLIYI